MMAILRQCHEGPTGDHHGGNRTTRKVLQSGFYWPSLFRDADSFVRHCDSFKRTGNVSNLNEMPQTVSIICEIFDVWGIDFLGPFPSSFGNKYILVAMDYISRWVEAQPSLPMMQDELWIPEAIVSHFGTPMVIINDRGTHFQLKFDKLLDRYGVTHWVSITYHPQRSGQVELLNRELKRILEKTLDQSRKDWSAKLDDALWAYHTTYKYQ
ncbi:unnamed protein product [Linum trigynum]|uniref:Integrase catalytic domain-containing protein n=1 Tax=Linum trigynum TaxID=586398 RepID=A0AAV2DAK7_9ROSI